MNPYAILGIIVLVLGMMTGSYFKGRNDVQLKWDIETSRLEAIASWEKQKNKENIESIEAQHKKDIEHAKTNAGRNAVSAWLKSHGMLPDGSAVSGSGNCKAESSSQSDEISGQSGTGNGIEAFATDCALDALHVLMFQEWVKREGMD